MDISKQPVPPNRQSLALMLHNGDATSFAQFRTDNAQASGSRAGRYHQIIIKEPSTAEPKRAKRKRITPEQLKELTAVFESTDTPTHDIREVLSKKLGMTNREVQVWFQNRRAKYNRLRIEHQRQMRANAAIMYNAGIVAHAPEVAPRPPTAPYARLRPQLSHPDIPTPRMLTAVYSHSVSHSSEGQPRRWPVYAPTSAAEPYGQPRPSGPMHTETRRTLAFAPPALAATSTGSNSFPGSALSNGASLPTPVSANVVPLDSTPPHSGCVDATWTRAHEQVPPLPSHCTYPLSYSASPRRQRAPEPTSEFTLDNADCKGGLPSHHAQRQHLPHSFGNSVPPARRNTVSSYQPASYSAASSGAGRSNQHQQAYSDSSHTAPSNQDIMAARARYQSDMSANHSRHNFGCSPAQGHLSYSDCAYIGESQSSRESPVVSTVAFTCQPMTEAPSVKLPSIQAILAEVDHVGGKETCPYSLSPQQQQSRSRAYTSPPLNLTDINAYHVGPSSHVPCAGQSEVAPAECSLPLLQPPPPSPPTKAAYIQRRDVFFQSESRRALYASSSARDSSPCAQYCPESPTSEPKLAIDLLATAAVSVSSAKSSCSLPHLTPLSEFSLRVGSQQQFSPVNTPMQLSHEHQTTPPSNDMPRANTRSRNMTPDECKIPATHSWRPW